MNYKTTIFLVVLLALVGVYFFYIDKGPTDDRPLNDPGAKPRLIQDEKFAADKVNKITIERGVQTIVLEKDGADWKQTAPVQFGVNNWSAEQFAGDALKLELAPGKPEIPSLEDAGLAPPQATLTLVTPDATKVIKLGRTLSIGGRGYAMVGDDKKVQVVPDTLHKLVLEGKPGEWRKKSLTGPKEGQASRVTLTRDGKVIELVKTDGHWALGAPNSGRASTSAVSDLLNAMGHMYINQFVKDQPEDLGVYGLKTPRIVLHVEQAAADEKSKPTATELRVGAPVDLEKKYYFATIVIAGTPGKGGDIVFQVDKDDVAKFEKAVNDLRDKRLTPLVTNDVSHVTVSGAGSTVKYERTVDGWAFAKGGPAYPADAKRVGDMLTAITSADAESYIADYAAAADKGDPALTLTLEASARPEPDVLKMWKQGADKLVVLRNNEAIGYVLPTSKLELATGATAALSMRTRTVDSLPKDAITLVTLGERKFERKDGTWQMAGAEKFETSALTALLDAAAPVEADGWISAEGAVDKGLVIKLADAQGKEATLTIDAAGKRASATNTVGVFVPSEKLLSAAQAEFAYRTVLDFPADQIKSVKVGDTVIEKGESDSYSNPDKKAIDKEKAGKVFDTLAGLRAERFAPAFGAAKQTIIVTMNDGKSHTLEIDANGNARLDGKTFALAKADAEALTTSVVAQDTGK